MEAARAAAPAIETESPPTIPCKYCDMKFSSMQALGGHQNRHRVDREVAKRSRIGLADITGRVTNIVNHSEQQEVENCSKDPVGLCIWCMKSAPLKLCVDRPAPSEIALMMQKTRNQNLRPQRSTVAMKWSGARNVVGTSTGTGSEAAAYKYNGKTNVHERAAAAVLGSRKKVVQELDLTLRL